MELIVKVVALENREYYNIVNCLDVELSMNYTSGLNIKTVLSTYGDFHVKDKTAVRTSYL